ncbi:hypothetical protein T07_12225 [Trichinella nelsoni]|uniref:Secreted protein n=1 Tax=Trichinella nelsoni TaxID=6336 RepID=A0A0V0S8N8_9BILA|nr:hypothetical protein T07_12225 [Trichinella nelsoni]
MTVVAGCKLLMYLTSLHILSFAGESPSIYCTRGHLGEATRGHGGCAVCQKNAKMNVFGAEEGYTEIVFRPTTV